MKVSPICAWRSTTRSTPSGRRHSPPTVIATHVVAMRPDAELFAWWLADLVLAQGLRRPLPLPLLMARADRAKKVSSARSASLWFR